MFFKIVFFKGGSFAFLFFFIILFEISIIVVIMNASLLIVPIFLSEEN